MNKKLLVVVAIIFLGLTYVSFYSHEWFHKYEMRNVEMAEEKLCVSLFRTCEIYGKKQLFGYYHFFPADQENYDKAVEIINSGRGWEFRAYAFQTIFPTLIILNGLWIFLIYTFCKKRKNAPRILK